MAQPKLYVLWVRFSWHEWRAMSEAVPLEAAEKLRRSTQVSDVDGAKVVLEFGVQPVGKPDKD